MNIGKVRRANGKSDIAFVFAKKALYLFVRVFSVMKGDFRVFLFKSRDTFRSYQAQDAVSRKKIDFSVLALIDLLDVFVNVVVGIQNLRQMFIEVFSVSVSVMPEVVRFSSFVWNSNSRFFMVLLNPWGVM